MGVRNFKVKLETSRKRGLDEYDARKDATKGKMEKYSTKNPAEMKVALVAIVLTWLGVVQRKTKSLLWQNKAMKVNSTTRSPWNGLTLCKAECYDG